jgi:spore coat protein U-like protein
MKANLIRTSLLVAAVAFALSMSAFAATATSTFAVTANVIADCTITSGTAPLAFGTYWATTNGGSTGAAVNGSTTITFTCPLGVVASMALNGGNYEIGSTGTAPVRQMSDGQSTPHFLAYTLYTDSDRTSPWGYTGAAIQNLTVGAQSSLTVYGKIAGGQAATAPIGSYTDTVTVLVTYN